MDVFFGSQIPDNSTTFEEMKAVAQTMDRGLWHSAWTYDHFLPPEVVRHKIAVLERHCADVGRDPGEITRTIFLPVALQDDPDKAAHLRSIWGPGLGLAEKKRERYLAIGSADHLINVFRQYQQVGVQGIIFQGIPNRPRLYEPLNDEVLAAFA